MTVKVEGRLISAAMRGQASRPGPARRSLPPAKQRVHQKHYVDDEA